MRVQNPIVLSRWTEPQPDLTLLRPRADFYAERHPGPADVLLAVEVAETSGVYDRGTKLALYARARIPEVWIVDVRGDRRRLVRGQRLPSPVLPRTTFRVAEILG